MYVELSQKTVGARCFYFVWEIGICFGGETFLAFGGSPRSIDISRIYQIFCSCESSVTYTRSYYQIFSRRQCTSTCSLFFPGSRFVRIFLYTISTNPPRSPIYHTATTMATTRQPHRRPKMHSGMRHATMLNAHQCDRAPAPLDFWAELFLFIHQATPPVTITLSLLFLFC